MHLQKKEEILFIFSTISLDNTNTPNSFVLFYDKIVYIKTSDINYSCLTLNVNDILTCEILYDMFKKYNFNIYENVLW